MPCIFFSSGGVSTSARALRLPAQKNPALLSGQKKGHLSVLNNLTSKYDVDLTTS